MIIKNITMEIISSYMDDEIREKVHFELAPCTNKEFLKRYCEYDETFKEFLLKEFYIDIE